MVRVSQGAEGQFRCRGSDTSPRSQHSQLPVALQLFGTVAHTTGVTTASSDPMLRDREQTHALKRGAKSHSVVRGWRRPRVQEPVFSNIPSSLREDLVSLEPRVNSDLRTEEINNGFPLNYG